jgi:hypothetical protein
LHRLDVQKGGEVVESARADRWETAATEQLLQMEDDFRDLLIPSFSEADLEAAVAYFEHVAEND